MNPYFHLDFISFFPLFFERLWQLFSGRLPLASLASDEIQFFVMAAVGTMGAMVGTFLILRRQAMLANSLSHTVLFGIVSAYLLLSLFFSSSLNMVLTLPILFTTAILTALFTAFLTHFCHRVLSVNEEGAIGLVFTSLFALGLFLLSLYAKNLHLGTELITGNADALQYADLKIVLWVWAIAAALLFLFFKELKITTFDPTFAKTKGISPSLYGYLLMTLTALTSMAAFRAVGVLMGLAFFVGPPLVARLFTKRLIPLLFLSFGMALAVSLFGVALSRHLLTVYALPLSTSGLIVSSLFVTYLIFLFFRGKKIKSFSSSL